MTADPALARQLRQDLADIGCTAIGNEDDGYGDSADIILLDCRDAVSASQGNEFLRQDAIILAIIDGSTGPIKDILLEVADIIFYPCLKEELYARIVLAAGKNGHAQRDDTFGWDGFRINFTNYEVSVDGNKLDLTYKEYELLKCLALSPGRVFTRSQLLKNVWGYDYTEGARTVDVHIRRLRSKLGARYAALIETVRHVGYRFKRTTSY